MIILCICDIGCLCYCCSIVFVSLIFVSWDINLIFFFKENWPTESSAVPVEVIIDMWTSAGIANAKTLLDNLGFTTNEIQISQLSVVIDDDLQSMQNMDKDNAVTSLLRVKEEKCF